MPALEGLDIAWSQPSVGEIEATGAHWVARYLSPDLSKNLTAAHVRAYLAAGLGIITVWESTASRATQGIAAGVGDAHAAVTQRAAAGLPATVPIYFAVDEDTTWPAVQAYFEGVISVLGVDHVGCYGGYHVIEGAAAHGIRYLWQTVAWSNGMWSSHATIRQPGATLLGGNADVDYAEVPDFGQYPRPVVVPPTPAPIPVPHKKETDMIIVSVAHIGAPGGPPKGTDWPGDFLLADGKLSHIVHETDEEAFRAAGIPGPVVISWDQYQSLLAGH